MKCRLSVRVTSNIIYSSPPPYCSYKPSCLPAHRVSRLPLQPFFSLCLPWLLKRAGFTRALLFFPNRPSEQHLPSFLPLCVSPRSRAREPNNELYFSLPPKHRLSYFLLSEKKRHGTPEAQLPGAAHMRDRPGGFREGRLERSAHKYLSGFSVYLPRPTMYTGSLNIMYMSSHSRVKTVWKNWRNVARE